MQDIPNEATPFSRDRRKSTKVRGLGSRILWKVETSDFNSAMRIPTVLMRVVPGGSTAGYEGREGSWPVIKRRDFRKSHRVFKRRSE